MALNKRGRVWWIDIVCDGRRIRRSAETSNKKLAEKIHAKVLTQVTEGKWFDEDEGKRRTFLELAEKYEDTEFKELKGWYSVRSYLKRD